MESDQPTDDEPVQTSYCIKLVPQEQLDDAMKEFEHVSSIHIYSLGPSNSNVSWIDYYPCSARFC